MRKRVLALLLTVAMVASLVVAPAGAAGLPFTDVKEGDWFREAVEFVYDEGIMSGMSATEFGPNQNLTRAQAAQLLYNYEGKPEINGDAFDDVEQGQWYYNAVNWAAYAGVVSGMGDRLFAPNNDLTREQLVTILMNYAQYKGYDTSASASLADFTDADQVSSWAVNRLQWAVAEKLVNGMGDGTVAPKGTATRAQMAAIMKNFVGRFDLPGGHSVTFVTYSGSSVDGQVVAKGNYATEPEAPTIEGGSFGAWYTDPEYTRIYLFDDPVTEDLTLYARWNYDNYSLGEYDFDRSTQTLSVGVMSQTDTVLEVRLLDQDSEALLVQTTINVAATLAEQEEAGEENPAGEEGLLELTEQQITALCPDAPEYFALYLALKNEDTGEIYASLNSIHFTEAYAEFEAKTVDDFDADRVVNFDEVTDNNFGVLAEGVEQVASDDTVNTYDGEASDIEAGLYVFANADADLLDTQPGEVIYWPGENSNIISVAEVSVNGDTVTLVAAEENDLTTYYDYIKVDMELDPDAFAEEELDPYEETIVVEAGEDGNYYEVTDSREDLNLNAEIIDIDRKASSIKRRLPVKLEVSGRGDQVTGSVEGSAGVELTPKLAISWDVRLFKKDDFEFSCSLKTEFKAELTAKLEIGAGGNETTGKEAVQAVKKLPLGKVTIPFGVTGLNAAVSLNQGFRVTWSAEVTLSLTHTTDIKLAYSRLDGRSTSKKSNTNTSLTLSGSLEFRIGPEIRESVEFLNGVVSLSLVQEAGAKLVLTETWEAPLVVEELTTEKHDCDLCLDVQLMAFLEVRVEMSYKVTKHLRGTPFTGTLFKVEGTVKPGHISSKSGFGWGECPNKSYRVQLEVLDTEGNAYNQGTIRILDETDQVVFTGANEDRTYLANGTYTAWLNEGEETTATATFEVDGEGVTVTLTREAVDDGGDEDEDIAPSGGTCGENVQWTLNGEGVLEIYGQGAMYDYEGSSIYGLPWYHDRDNIRKVVVREGVTHIGISAFYQCENLKTVELAESVLRIGERAFSRCTALTVVNIPTTCYIEASAFSSCISLAEVTIPEGVQGIGMDAFWNSGLIAVTIPGSVGSIGKGAFADCKELTEVTISNGVTIIGDGAFNGTGLTSVIIPESVRSIGNYAFTDCPDLTAIHVDEANEVFDDIDGVLYDINHIELICWPAGIADKVTIPEGVQEIGLGSFSDCENLVEVTIPNSVTTIGTSAFSRCFGLRRVTIPSSVNSIGDSAFYFCDNLETVILSEGVKKIGNSAFRACGSLRSVTIPVSLISVDYGAFMDSSKITDVYYAGSEEDFENINFDDYNTSLTNATIHYNYTGA